MKATRKTSLRPVHHSFADWDFNHPGWSISPADFVSPPSSLREWSIPPDHLYILSKHPSCLQLPQGRIVTYFKISQVVAEANLLFLNTAPPGTANIDNTYMVIIDPTPPSIMLTEWESGGYIRGWLFDNNPIAINAWTNWRLSWWLSWGLLQVRLEEEVAAVWVQRGTDISIEDPLFGEETYQRPGIGLCRLPGGVPDWADDTGLWIPA